MGSVRNLFKRESIPLFALALVFLASVGMIFYDYTRSKKQIHREFVAEKLSAARSTASDIRAFLDHEQLSLDNIADNISAADTLDKGRAGLTSYFRNHKKSPKLFTYMVLDDKGRFLYSVPDSIEDRRMQDLSGQEFFTKAMKAKEFQNLGVMQDRYGQWQLFLSSPIINDKSGIVGVLVETISLRTFDEMFIKGVSSGHSGNAFMVDENGRLIASQRRDALYSLLSSGENVKQMMHGDEGAVENPFPKHSLTVFSPVDFSGKKWSVGITSTTTMNYEEAWGTLFRALFRVGMLAIVFTWSLVSVRKSARYKSRLRERAQVLDGMVVKNRELTALNDFYKSIGAGIGLDGILERAVELILAQTESDGCAIRLVSGSSGELILRASGGGHVPFADTRSCAMPAGCLCEKVFSSEKPLFVHAGDESWPSEMPACGIRSEDSFLLVPLLIQKKPVGMIYIWGMNLDGLSDDTESFITAFSNQLTSAIENVQNIEDVNRYAARASALFHVASALTRPLELDELFTIIMKEAAGLLKVNRCMLLLYSEEENLISCRVSLGFEYEPLFSFSPSGIFWDAMRDGGLKLVDMEERQMDIPRKFLDEVDLSRFAVVPLISKGKALGFLVLETVRREKIVIEDMKMLVGFANQAAVAIENSSYYIRMIEKYNQDLQRLSSRIIETQEEERKRIARDLHDELGQYLSALKMTLELFRRDIPESMEHLRAKVDDMLVMVTSSIDSVRRLAFELRPSVLDDLGLVSALGKLATDFRKRSGIEIRFEHEGMLDRVGSQVEVTLYRVVQEALNNITKHSAAQNVHIDLKKNEDKGTVILYMEDDGTGFDESTDNEPGSSRGFGLLSMKERVSLLGGNFRLLTEKGKGTKILVDIPYR